MSYDRKWERRLRIEVEIGKEIPSEEEIRQWDEAVASTPNAVLPQPYNRVWITRLQITDPDDDERTALGYERSWATSLGGALDGVLRHLRYHAVTVLARESVPIDARLAAVLGTPKELARDELAARLADILELPEPPAAAGELLIAIALSAQTHYDDPHGRGSLESASTSDVFEYLGAKHPDAAVASWLDVEERDVGDRLRDIGLGLLEKMGFRLW
jgi:hypothetical protein